MASLGSYYFSDMIPCGICVEWPYAYVTGAIYHSVNGTYTMDCKKLRIDSYPITVVDRFASPLHYNSSTYLVSCSISGDYLYMVGGYNGGTVGSPDWRYTCIKVEKDNLGTVIWNHDEIPVDYGPTAVSYWTDVMANSTDSYVVCSGVSSPRACVYKLNASTGDMLLKAESVYSGVGGILGFYNSEASVDVSGSAGGIKQIFRYNTSTWVMNGIANADSRYTNYRGELYNGYYYVSGQYYPNPPDIQYWQKGVWKLLQTTCAKTWGVYRDDVALGIQEFNCCSTVDGPGGYVYSVGYQYFSGTTTGPIQGTLSKYDLDGNFQWAINYGDNLFSQNLTSIKNYGDYLITAEVETGVAGGWLKLRNKSDGSVANLPPMGHYFPTFFQGTTF